MENIFAFGLIQVLVSILLFYITDLTWVKASCVRFVRIKHSIEWTI